MVVSVASKGDESEDSLVMVIKPLTQEPVVREFFLYGCYVFIFNRSKLWYQPVVLHHKDIQTQNVSTGRLV